MASITMGFQIFMWLTIAVGCYEIAHVIKWLQSDE